MWRYSLLMWTRVWFPTPHCTELTLPPRGFYTSFLSAALRSQYNPLSPNLEVNNKVKTEWKMKKLIPLKSGCVGVIDKPFNCQLWNKTGPFWAFSGFLDHWRNSTQESFLTFRWLQDLDVCCFLYLIASAESLPYSTNHTSSSQEHSYHPGE